MSRMRFAIIISTITLNSVRVSNERKREMGDRISLKIEERKVRGKKVKNLRKAGITPAVVYGHGMEPMAVQAEAGELRRVVALAGRHTPINLTGVKRRIAMIKDVEYNQVKSGAIRHVSFHAVKADEPVTAVVPIRLVGTGESEAEKAGLVVLQAIDKIEVKALPMELPEALEVSVINLREAGDHVTVGDIIVPEGVEIVDKDDGREGTDDDDVTVMDLVVASAYEPVALEAANDAAAGEAEDESTATADESGDQAGNSGDDSKVES